ncbi:phospholipid phosphatase 5 [Agrilus planipennis]|uniref:Phospholipid phosphatase 5 n=1 Tax=Agrilus planipennis TaxID=224129 RepID=A0A7F5RNF4_AGRPL|nr:phospholipid phosphatase 5 [Agrilus planipennis]
MRDVPNVLEGVSLACSLSGIIAGVLKCAVGRPRPDFYNRCFPDGRGDAHFKCTGDRIIVMDGRKSFPSGHAAFAFASMHFICLYLCSKLKIFENHRGEIWRICLCISPLILSSLIAASRICDHHHHPEDVIAGSILGSMVSHFVYYQYFNELSLTPERNLTL